MLQQGDIPNRDGNIVVYIEFSGGDPQSNEVSLKFEWPYTPYTSGQALVVVKNGSIKMTGNSMGTFHGVVYCHDGPVRVAGSGQGESTSFVWGNGLDGIGNFVVNMPPEFLADATFFARAMVRLHARIVVGTAPYQMHPGE